MKRIVTILGLFVFITGFSNVYAQEVSKTSTTLKSPDQIEEYAKSQVAKISISTLKSLKHSDEKFLLIDVRTEREYIAGHLEGAVWIPRGMLEFMIQDLTKDPLQKMFLYCRTGGRSALSVRTLMEMGFKNVLNLSGGFEKWVTGGNPVFNQHGEIKVVNFERKEVERIRSMPGGWNTAEVTPDVEKALDYVLKQMNTSAKLEKILKVKTQVVAGLNYDIDFQLDNGEIWNTIVFRDLSGNYSMTKPATRKDMATSN